MFPQPRLRLGCGVTVMTSNTSIPSTITWHDGDLFGDYTFRITAAPRAKLPQTINVWGARSHEADAWSKAIFRVVWATPIWESNTTDYNWIYIVSLSKYAAVLFGYQISLIMKYMSEYKREFPLYLFCRKSDARYKHKQKLIITVCYFEMLWDDIYRFVVNSPILFTIIIVISTRFCQGKELMIRQQITNCCTCFFILSFSL